MEKDERLISFLQFLVREEEQDRKVLYENCSVELVAVTIPEAIKRGYVSHPTETQSVTVNKKRYEVVVPRGVLSLTPDGRRFVNDHFKQNRNHHIEILLDSKNV